MFEKMDSILIVFTEIAVLVAVMLGGCITLLLYRHPNHGKWLESETVSTAVMILLMSAGIFGLASLVEGLTTLNFEPVAALGLTAAIATAIIWGGWKALRMRPRLDAAAEGRSPFRLAARALARAPKNKTRAA